MYMMIDVLMCSFCFFSFVQCARLFFFLFLMVCFRALERAAAVVRWIFLAHPPTIVFSSKNCI